MTDHGDSTERSGDWGDLEALPPQKSTVPRWLWGCGGCALLLLILVLGAGWWAVDWWQDGTDVESQWERIAEILPYDEPSQSYELGFGQQVPFTDFEVFVFTPEGALDERGRWREPDPGEDDDPKARRSKLFVVWTYFGPGVTSEEVLEQMTTAEAESFTFTVQGRELDGFRQKDGPGTSGVPGLPGPPGGASTSTLVALPVDDGGVLLMMFVRTGSEEQVEPEEIQEFLRPFHVGPDR